MLTIACVFWLLDGSYVLQRAFYAAPTISFLFFLYCAYL